MQNFAQKCSKHRRSQNSVSGCQLAIIFVCIDMSVCVLLVSFVHADIKVKAATTIDIVFCSGPISNTTVISVSLLIVSVYPFVFSFSIVPIKFLSKI